MVWPLAPHLPQSLVPMFSQSSGLSFGPLGRVLINRPPMSVFRDDAAWNQFSTGVRRPLPFDFAAPWRYRKKNGQSIHFWFRLATIRFERQHNRCGQREVEYVEQIRGSAFCDFHVYWDGKRQGRAQALPLLHRRHGQSNLCLQHGYIRTLSCAV
jgi:hypothetical protein